MAGKIVELKGSIKGKSCIVATLSFPDGEVRHLAYTESTSSGDIIKDAVTVANSILVVDEVRIHTEEFERSRGLRDGGVNVGFNLDPASGSVGFHFERKAKKEIKTIKDIVFRRVKST